MKFSERYQYQEVRTHVQLESIDTPLKNSLWNIFVKYYARVNSNSFTYFIWVDHFAWRIDTRPPDSRRSVSQQIQYSRKALEFIRSYWESADWYERYDLVEFSANYFKKYQNLNGQFIEEVQFILKKYMSGFRFVDGVLCQVTEDQEIESIEQALGQKKFSSTKIHIHQALLHLSDRQNPDYRNSVKESISAVEAVCRELTGKRSLGDALNELESTGNLHKALKEGWKKIYGYTSDGDGIRHPLMDEPNLNSELAKFFLISCSSFVNLLISLKSDK